jgi:uncharacterized protein with von Willebrand factor type A (vWA) domain
MKNEAKRTADAIFEANVPGNTLTTRIYRNFLKFISIDPLNIRTWEYLRSTDVINAEIVRHIIFHHNVIHYYSRFR